MRISDWSSDVCSSDLDGDPFSPADRTDGEPLRLFDHQAIGGHFESLEAWCFEHALPFSRWCAGYPGGWEAERVVCTGTGTIETYPETEKGDEIGRASCRERVCQYV